MVVLGVLGEQNRVSPMFYVSWISARTNHGFEGSAVNREYCQGFISRTPAQLQDGSLPKGLNEYPTQLPHLRQLWTRIGSKCLVMYDCKQPSRLITAPDYLRNLQEEMSQVATRTFNVLYYFPFIWFNGSYYPRSYI